MSKSKPKSFRFRVGLVGDFQLIDVPECLSSWMGQGTDLKNGRFLYFAACFRGIVIYAVQLKIQAGSWACVCQLVRLLGLSTRWA